MISKRCKLCKQLFFRKSSHNDLNWSQKETCSNNCRVKYYQRHGGRGVPYDEWEPTEEDLAEIERRKAEVRAAALGHLVFAGVDG